ncbi:hypothetical protein BJ322DRAFT_1109522 [Thelephora terrestris]|uniref:Uncharacterized protein n=1 Tax=Thelephora terrestris TaxID=56493 RepID=A0A9P6HD67_9AGAM|nr:hypothetical protein BJ322DRAFT_1109522 [Thelephora terrestris]
MTSLSILDCPDEDSLSLCFATLPSLLIPLRDIATSRRFPLSTCDLRLRPATCAPSTCDLRPLDLRPATCDLRFLAFSIPRTLFPSHSLPITSRSVPIVSRLFNSEGFVASSPYANELLNRGVEFVTEANETFNSVLEASVLHTGNVGSMLMDEVAHVNERIDGRREEIEALENWKEDMQGVIHGQEDTVVRQGADIDLLKGEVTTLKDLVRALVTKTGELEDDKVRLTRRVSELTGEVRELQRRYNEPVVRVEEEEGEEVLHRAGSPIIPNRAESPPARLLVRHENRLVPIDDEVIEIGSEEFYQNVGVVRRDTPRPEFVSTPWGSRRQWPALEYDPYAEFVPDSEPNSDTELPDYDDLSDVDPNEIREQNWLNEELVRSALEVVQRIRRDID